MACPGLKVLPHFLVPQKDDYKRIAASKDLDTIPLAHLELERLRLRLLVLQWDKDPRISRSRILRKVRGLVKAPVSYDAYLTAMAEYIEFWQRREFKKIVYPTLEDKRDFDIGRGPLTFAPYVFGRGEKFGVEVLIFPELTKLDHEQIMHFVGNRVFPVGVVEKKVTVHGSPYSSRRYANHDLRDHTREWLVMVGGRSKELGISAEEVLRRFKIVNDRVLQKISLVDSEAERARMRYAWYYANHEVFRVVLSGKEMREALPQDHFESLINYKLKIEEPARFVSLVGKNYEDWAASIENVAQIVDQAP